MYESHREWANPNVFEDLLSRARHWDHSNGANGILIPHSAFWLTPTAHSGSVSPLN